ncbi:hypothetical protein KCU61_g381, partial [Aureobasidium melanogenum]
LLLQHRRLDSCDGTLSEAKNRAESRVPICVYHVHHLLSEGAVGQRPCLVSRGSRYNTLPRNRVYNRKLFWCSASENISEGRWFTRLDVRDILPASSRKPSCQKRLHMRSHREANLDLVFIQRDARLFPQTTQKPAAFQNPLLSRGHTARPSFGETSIALCPFGFATTRRPRSLFLSPLCFPQRHVTIVIVGLLFGLASLKDDH